MKVSGQTSKQNELEIIKRSAPYFQAIGVDCSTWPATRLHALLPIITDCKEVQALYQHFYDGWRLTLKSTKEVWLEADYIKAIPPDALMLNAIKGQLPVTKAAIRAAVLAKAAA